MSFTLSIPWVSGLNIIFAVFCYIINYPKMWLVKITNMYYPRACVCQESGCHTARCLWLTASNKVTVKSLAEAAVTWRVVWGWSICFQEGSLLVGVECQCLTGYCQEASLHYMHLSIGLLECLGIAAGLPQSEQGGSQNILYLSLGSKALTSATFSMLEIT